MCIDPILWEQALYGHRQMRLLRLALPLLLQFTLIDSVGAQSPGQFDQLEDGLLRATTLSLDFQVVATGAISVSIEGSLRKTASDDIALNASGDFAGQEVDLIALKRGPSFEYGSRSAPTTTTAPEALWEALVIGFTRMGILHNIANLSAGVMPDHAEGGAAEWVMARNVRDDGNSIAFDIFVSDTPSGSATLQVDDHGNPEIRRQTVAFPGGEMHVVETYSNVTHSE